MTQPPPPPPPPNFLFFSSHLLHIVFFFFFINQMSEFSEAKRISRILWAWTKNEENFVSYQSRSSHCNKLLFFFWKTVLYILCWSLVMFSDWQMEGSASYSLHSGSVSLHTHTHIYTHTHQFYETETISHLHHPFCFQRWETWSSSAQCKTTTWLNMALTVPSSPLTCDPTVSSPATPCAMSHQSEPCVGQTCSGRTGYAVPTYLSFGPLCSKTTRLKRQTWMPLGNRWEMVGRQCWMYTLNLEPVAGW